MNGQLIQGGVVSFVTLAIANGQTVSGSLDLGNDRLANILTSAAWKTANITFNVSADGAHFVPLNDSDGATPMIEGAVRGRAYGLGAAMREVLKAVRWLQVVSSVAQGEGVELTLGVTSSIR